MISIPYFFLKKGKMETMHLSHCAVVLQKEMLQEYVRMTESMYEVAKTINEHFSSHYERNERLT